MALASKQLEVVENIAEDADKLVPAGKFVSFSKNQKLMKLPRGKPAEVEYSDVASE